MNCPKCSTRLILLREGKPAEKDSFRKYWTNLWACEKCDHVFCPEFFARGNTIPCDEARVAKLESSTHETYSIWRNATISRYRELLALNSADRQIRDIHLTWPSYGNDIYVPTRNQLVLGGLATVEEKNNGGPRLGWAGWANVEIPSCFLCVEEHPGHEYRWEELVPIQEALKKEFGNNRAQVILPNDKILKPGDKIYLEPEYCNTEHYKNHGFTSEDYEYTHFSDLSEDEIIPVIVYNCAGIATITRVSADVDKDGREYCKFQTRERGEYSWYDWKELADKQEELKKKLGDREASVYRSNLDVRPADYEKVSLELFGYVPRN